MVNSFVDNFDSAFRSALDNRIIHYEHQLKELEKMNHKIDERLQIISISIIVLSIVFTCLLVLPWLC
jgi:hypothetical protein